MEFENRIVNNAYHNEDKVGLKSAYYEFEHDGSWYSTGHKVFEKKYFCQDRDMAL